MPWIRDCFQVMLRPRWRPYSQIFGTPTTTSSCSPASNVDISEFTKIIRDDCNWKLTLTPLTAFTKAAQHGLDGYLVMSAEVLAGFRRQEYFSGSADIF